VEHAGWVSGWKKGRTAELDSKSGIDVLHPPSIPEEEQKIVEENPMTEDEERELAELMGSDEE
jgi:hypothetical protein